MSPYDIEEHVREISSLVKEIGRDLTVLKIEVSALKIKSGIWGLLGGLIPTIGVVLMYLLTKL